MHINIQECKILKECDKDELYLKINKSINGMFVPFLIPQTILNFNAILNLKKLVTKFSCQIFLCVSEGIKLLIDDSLHFHTKLHNNINIPKHPFSEGCFHSTQKETLTLPLLKNHLYLDGT